MEHPSSFPSMLRKDPVLAASMGSLRKDSQNAQPPWNHNNRTGYHNGSGSLKKGSSNCAQDSCFLQVPRRCSTARRFSTDSLDSRRNSWDPGRRGSAGSGFDEPIWEDKVGDVIELGVVPIPEMSKRFSWFYNR